MYYIDSPTRNVVSYAYNLADGTLSGRKVVYTVPQGEGWPDGMTIGTARPRR